MTLNRFPCIVIPAYNPGSPLLTLIDELIAGGPEGLRFVVVNDGSHQESKPVFDRLSACQRVTVLNHAVNLGKGAALKTAFNHVLLTDDASGVVTADADGQHLPGDILAVAKALEAAPETLVLGSRDFKGQVPWRSRIGNSATRLVTAFLTGRQIKDTQTGLRGVPRGLLPRLMRLKPTGYDYEMNMLTEVCSQTPIEELPISTVYSDGNACSHFNPLFDSIAIYFVLLRHVGNSILTSLIDFVFFALTYAVSDSIAGSLIAGRLFACLFNFTAGKVLVFKSKAPWLRELIIYALLVIVLACIAYSAIRLLTSLGWNVFLAKALIETVIFLASFSVQRIFIFNSPAESKDKATDWDS
ncbi:MAG: bifunctional glycosyltransferase family 2/GtrA family protein [Candidatus Adiutrix sp.]|jgi:glycosyltransferase involved in cell wall biosynthesis|nr:bifunctional glycosyltransferase family 2/GtrA family protein [Candidatus Adiutrix sp.]